MTQTRTARTEQRKAQAENRRQTIAERRAELEQARQNTTSETPKGAAPVHERPVTTRQPESSQTQTDTAHTVRPTMQPVSPAIRELVVIVFSDEEDGGSGGNLIYGGVSVSQEVLSHKPMLEKYAREYGIEEYINVLLAILQVESGGTLEDVNYSWEQSAASIDNRTNALKGYLTGKLKALNVDTVRKDIPVSSALTDFQIWEITEEKEQHTSFIVVSSLHRITPPIRYGREGYVRRFKRYIAGRECSVHSNQLILSQPLTAKYL